MKYRVKVTWTKEETVEAESKDDAINQVLHSAAQPHRRLTANRVVEACGRPSQGKILLYKRRRSDAMSRWKKFHDARKGGKKLREIADFWGVSIRVVSRGIENFEEHLINQKAA